MKTRILLAVVLIIAAAALLLLLRRGGDEEPRRVDALVLSLLQNAEYLSDYTDAGRVALMDGRYEDPEEGITVALVDSLVAYGDLTGDGLDEVALVLATNMGGSGVFLDLAVVADRDGVPVNVAVIDLGDRIRVESMEIRDRQVVLDMIVHGPGDPMCCPTRHATEKYGLHGEEIELEDESPPGRIRYE